MAAARFWRIVGVETYAGGDLELSALHLYAGATRVDGTAALTCSHTPIAGTLADLQDADTATTCRFADDSVRSGGFSLTWDFGAGNTVEITATRPGGGGDHSAFMAGCTLQSSADTAAWAYEGVFGRYPWPGANTMSVAPAPGGDAAYATVALLLSLNGAEGSVAFTDSSPSPKALTVYGGAKISTAQSKFGGASAYFDGSGDYLAVANPSDFAFGTQDFTIEWWSFRTAPKADALIFSTSIDGSANGGYWIDFADNDLAMYGPLSGLIIRANGVGTADGVWNHWAVTRSGTTVRAFKNGGLLATASNATSLIATNARVGGTETFGGYDGWFNGYIDDLRITKGVARYTGDFTPPATSFPSSGFATGGIIFEAPTLHTVRGDIDIAASAPVPPFSTRSTARLQLARDIEFGGAGTIYGTTKTKGTPNVPTKARVVLQHQRSKLPVRETWSDPVTGAFTFTGIDPNQQFLTLAEDAAGNFRPIAANRITPEVAA